MELQRHRMGKEGRGHERRDRPDGSLQSGKEGLSIFIVPPGLPGYQVDEVLQKMGHRTSVAPRLTFENVRVPAENLIEGSKGNGDLAISKSFMWSGAVAGVAAVGVMRAVFEEVLDLDIRVYVHSKRCGRH